MKNNRTDTQRKADKRKGDLTEFDFQQRMASLGWSVMATGPLTLNSRNFAQIAYSNRGEYDGVFYTSAPDFTIWKPEVDPVMVQVKAKDIQGKLINGSAYFYLDEDQLFKMRKAARHFKGGLIFVVHCPELEAVPGLEEFSYVHIADLAMEKENLRQRIAMGKKVFVLPLDLFKPISQLRSFNNEIENTIPFGHDVGGTEAVAIRAA